MDDTKARTHLPAAFALGLAGITALGICLAPGAAAYTTNADGTYSVTTAELKEVFGDSVVASQVAFHLEDGYAWYNVPCSKKNPAKTSTRDFKRQTHTETSMTAAPTATGFTLTLTGTVNTDGNTRCPGGWKSAGSPTVIAQSKATDVTAVYNGASIELATG
ncbi:MAG: hypothetical protein KGP12_12665 [Actinomycetales bacterium]|nr:hypothetical protein [Actinomycetales bacterium]